MASNSEKNKDCEVEDGESWQLNKSVTECNQHMLEHEIATDVTFLVSCDSGQDSDSQVEAFSAHKYMLISRSPVFYTMFCGVLAERGEIRVTDVHPEAFRQMLNYIYTDDLELNSDLVPHVLNASTKYLLPGLTTKCAEFITAHLDTEHVCTILNQILIFEQTHLNEICLNFIMRVTKKVLESEAFLAISRDTLSKILGIKTCEVTEVDLFKACLKWARQRCEEEKKEPTGINIREALGDCVSKFRFSNLMVFAKEVCRTEVYTTDEEHGIICHLTDKQTFNAPDGFSCETRLRPIYSAITGEEIEEGNFQELTFGIAIYSYKKNAIKVNTLLIGKASPPSHNKISSYSKKHNDRNLTSRLSRAQDQNMGVFEVNNPLTCSSDMCGYSIRHNDKDVTGTFSNAWDKKMIQFQCNSPLFIEPGSSALQITYKKQSYFCGFVASSSGNVYGVPRSNITLQNGDRISLELSEGDYQFMPLLGLSYQLVLN